MRIIFDTYNVRGMFILFVTAIKLDKLENSGNWYLITIQISSQIHCLGFETTTSPLVNNDISER